MSKARLLYVLDDSKEQTAVDKALAQSYKLDFCYDAHDAASHVASTRPDILILSYRDDGVSPLALTHMLRLETDKPYVGIIYIAQSESSDWLHRLLDAGVDVCLPQEKTLLQLKASIDAVFHLCQAKAAIDQINSKNHSAYKKLKEQALTDKITGIGNLQFMHNQVRVEFKRAQRYQKHLVLLLLKIDDIKSFQRAAVWETLQQKVSRLIASTVRFEIDYTGRSDEGEFYVILPETDIDGAISVAERMRTQITRLQGESSVQSLTSSVGVVHYNGDRGNFETVDEFFATAKLALESAVSNGGDQYCALDTPSETLITEQSA